MGQSIKTEYHQRICDGQVQSQVQFMKVGACREQGATAQVFGPGEHQNKVSWGAEISWIQRSHR